MTRTELHTKLHHFQLYSGAGLAVQIDSIMDHDAEQRAEIEALRGVLNRLCHEVAGALYMRQYEIRNIIGNTNFACLEQRMREAEQAVSPEGDDTPPRSYLLDNWDSQA